jgi:hypothetical protein
MPVRELKCIVIGQPPKSGRCMQYVSVSTCMQADNVSLKPDMLDRSLEAEFESYRKTLSTDEARRAFDERIERLLSQHGVDYVRGYVDALKDASSGGSGG